MGAGGVGGIGVSVGGITRVGVAWLNEKRRVGAAVDAGAQAANNNPIIMR
jgi:hypothetical protein